jgi:hypothetical protein
MQPIDPDFDGTFAINNPVCTCACPCGGDSGVTNSLITYIEAGDEDA